MYWALPGKRGLQKVSPRQLNKRIFYLLSYREITAARGCRLWKQFLDIVYKFFKAAHFNGSKWFTQCYEKGSILVTEW